MTDSNWLSLTIYLKHWLVILMTFLFGLSVGYKVRRPDPENPTRR